MMNLHELPFYNLHITQKLFGLDQNPLGTVLPLLPITFLMNHESAYSLTYQLMPFESLK